MDGKILQFPRHAIDLRSQAVADLRETADRVERGDTKAVLIVEISEDEQGNHWWRSGNISDADWLMNLHRVAAVLVHGGDG